MARIEGVVVSRNGFRTGINYALNISFPLDAPSTNYQTTRFPGSMAREKSTSSRECKVSCCGDGYLFFFFLIFDFANQTSIILALANSFVWQRCSGSNLRAMRVCLPARTRDIPPLLGKYLQPLVAHGK